MKRENKKQAERLTPTAKRLKADFLAMLKRARAKR